MGRRLIIDKKFWTSPIRVVMGFKFTLALTASQYLYSPFYGCFAIIAVLKIVAHFLSPIISIPSTITIRLSKIFQLDYMSRCISVSYALGEELGLP